MSAKQTAQTGSRAGRIYCVLAANVLSAASVGAAYFGATQNASAFVLAVGFAAAATLLFRYRRQGAIGKEPLWLRALIPTMYAMALAVELTKIAGAGTAKTVTPIGWTWTAILLMLVGWDFWCNRPLRKAGKL